MAYESLLSYIPMLQMPIHTSSCTCTVSQPGSIQTDAPRCIHCHLNQPLEHRMPRSWLCSWDLAIVLILLFVLLSRLQSRHSRLQTRSSPLPAPDERLFGPPLPRGGFLTDTATRRFEAAAYRAYYPEDSAGRSDEQLREHYLAVGRREHRVPRRLRVVLKYLAKAGLTNQHFCHVHFVAAALQAGAEVVLADAWHRGGTFGERYWDHPWPQVSPPIPLEQRQSDARAVARMLGACCGAGTAAATRLQHAIPAGGPGSSMAPHACVKRNVLHACRSCRQRA